MTGGAIDGRQHAAALIETLHRMEQELDRCDRWGQLLATAFSRGNQILAAGNGGSAADAQHLTAELVGRFEEERPPVRAIALSTDTSALTAIANDYGYEEVFARQVRAYARPGDVLVLFSTSGRSPNVLAAVAAARASGVASLALTGPGPSPLHEQADAVVAVPSPRTATIQEAHGVLLHVICRAFDRALHDVPTGSLRR